MLGFVAANICVYFQYLFMHFYERQNIFGAIVLKPRFKIDVVIIVPLMLFSAVKWIGACSEDAV